MSDKIGVGKVQSCGSTSSTKEPLLRNGLGVASVNCMDMIGACTLDDQPLLPLEYDSHTTLEDLYNQVSSCISTVGYVAFTFCFVSIVLST